MFAVLHLTHGFSVHTSVAVLGPLASLVVTGVLGAAACCWPASSAPSAYSTT